MQCFKDSNLVCKEVFGDYSLNYFDKQRSPRLILIVKNNNFLWGQNGFIVQHLLRHLLMHWPLSCATKRHGSLYILIGIYLFMRQEKGVAITFLVCSAIAAGVGYRVLSYSQTFFRTPKTLSGTSSWI